MSESAHAPPPTQLHGRPPPTHHTLESHAQFQKLLRLRSTCHPNHTLFQRCLVWETWEPPSSQGGSNGHLGETVTVLWYLHSWEGYCQLCGLKVLLPPNRKQKKLQLYFCHLSTVP